MNAQHRMVLTGQYCDSSGKAPGTAPSSGTAPS